MSENEKTGRHVLDADSVNRMLISRRTGENLSDEAKQARWRFVYAYLRGSTFRDAAIFAGFSPKSAAKKGSELYSEPYVQDLLVEMREKIEEDALVSRKDAIVGLLREAHYHGPNAMHGARVQAWAHLCKVMGYEAPQKVDVNHSGGVMLVPVSAPEDWRTAALESQALLKEEVRS